MISVVVLTKDEERDLPGCLESVRWCEDVHVVDSLSSDRTCEIAVEAGATVHRNPFQSFGTQRNWALDNCHARGEWILFLDADERVTPEMLAEMRRCAAGAPPDVAGFYCCWKLMLGDRWLRRSDNFPKWQLRLTRKGRVRFKDFGHGQKEGDVDGRLDYLSEPYLHYAFTRGWSHWESKHRSYAKQEAVARQGKMNWKDLFSRHGSKRNPALKTLLSRLPGWPAARFIFSYVIMGGFLEGSEGFDYCRRMAWYEARIQAELRSLKKSK